MNAGSQSSAVAPFVILLLFAGLVAGLVAGLTVIAIALTPSCALCVETEGMPGLIRQTDAPRVDRPCFRSDGTLTYRPPEEAALEWIHSERTEFIPNIRVDDGISPEHREPAVAWGPGGIMYAAYCERATHYNPEFIMFTRSEDGGMTWLAPAVRINDTTPNAAMMPAIDIMPDGSIVAAWCELKFGPHYNDEIRFSRSVDGGITWGQSVVVHPINPSTDYVRPSILVAGDRILVSYWQAVSYPNGYALVVYSDDQGLSWSSPVVITYTFGPYDGAAPCLSYNELLGNVGVVIATSNEQVFFCQSTDLGETWSPPVQVNDVFAGSVNYPDLDCAGGFFHVVWYDNRYGQFDCDIFYSQSNDGQTFTPSVKVNDSFSGNQYEPHIRVGADDLVHVCWIWNIPFQFNIDLYYSVSEDGGLSWEQPCPRVNDILYTVQPYVAWTSDLLADAHGNAYLFWNDGRTTNYYDSIYYSRTIDWSGIEDEASGDRPGPLASWDGMQNVVLSAWGQPGPEPVLCLQVTASTTCSRLELLDSSGRLINRTAVGRLDAGTHLFPLDCSLLRRSLPRGTYFARLHTKDDIFTQRITLVR